MGKITLPIKTKIAAWWMMIVNNVILLLFMVGVIFLCLLAGGLGGGIIPSKCDPFVSRLLLFLLSNLVFSIGILKRKRWAWWGSIILTSIIIMNNWFFLREYPSGLLVSQISINTKTYTIQFGLSLFSIITMITIIPLILFFLDRKNFWKIAT